MPTVDRNVLRIGTYELLWRDDIPDAVAISEAVQLARELSTDESPGFVNGLLARLLELKPTLRGEPGGRPPEPTLRGEPGGRPPEPKLSECQQRQLQFRCGRTG